MPRAHKSYVGAGSREAEVVGVSVECVEGAALERVGAAADAVAEDVTDGLVPAVARGVPTRHQAASLQRKQRPVSRWLRPGSMRGVLT